MERNHTLLLRAGALSLMMLIMSATTITARAAGNGDHAQGNSFIGGFNTVTVVSSTVPSNGDVNPYGVAQVPRSKGSLVEGDFLISNFNNVGN